MIFIRDEMVPHEMAMYPFFDAYEVDWFYNLATTADMIDLLLFGA